MAEFRLRKNKQPDPVYARSTGNSCSSLTLTTGLEPHPDLLGVSDKWRVYQNSACRILCFQAEELKRGYAFRQIFHLERIDSNPTTCMGGPQGIFSSAYALGKFQVKSLPCATSRLEERFRVNTEFIKTRRSRAVSCLALMVKTSVFWYSPTQSGLHLSTAIPLEKIRRIGLDPVNAVCFGGRGAG